MASFVLRVDVTFPNPEVATVGAGNTVNKGTFQADVDAYVQALKNTLGSIAPGTVTTYTIT
jgi:hypothetical protein